MENYLDEREERLAKNTEIALRDTSARQWMKTDLPPEQRLLKFDAWVRVKLEQLIDWKWAGEDKPRRIEQCRIELENLALGLWRRGWLQDGRKMAAHIEAALADISAAQKAGRVKDFWPFFKSVVNRYVGINSEEIKAEAMSAGTAIADVFTMLQKKAAPSLSELLAKRHDETLREKQTKQRRSEARQAADNAQAKLF